MDVLNFPEDLEGVIEMVTETEQGDEEMKAQTQTILSYKQKSVNNVLVLPQITLPLCDKEIASEHSF